jgi:hypothetical protein
VGLQNEAPPDIERHEKAPKLAGVWSRAVDNIVKIHSDPLKMITKEMLNFISSAQLSSQLMLVPLDFGTQCRAV